MLDSVTLTAIKTKLDEMEKKVEDVEKEVNSFTNILKEISEENNFGVYLDPIVGEHVVMLELLMEKHLQNANETIKNIYESYKKDLESEDNTDE